VKPRRVFVAGIGAISPLGDSWAATVAELAKGRCAVRPIEAFDVAGFPSSVAASIDQTFDTCPDRRLALARLAARQAWAMAQLNAPPERIGVFIGAESGRAPFATILALARAAGGGSRFDHEKFGTQARELAASIDASTLSPSAVASALAGEFVAHGPVHTVSIACASGAAAIVAAARAVRLGVCDVALTGGVGADVDPLMLVGFGNLGALSERGVSCPFDVRRDGFVLGEGAAMIVLTNDRTNAVAEVTGIARTLDAYHLTKPAPEGDGAFRAMQAALADANRSRVDYIQAHGTSTLLNDEAEAKAIRRLFGEATSGIHVSSAKGALGHWVAGAGALGFLCATESVRSGKLLPTAGLQEPDPSCELRHVLGEALESDVGSAMVNAFAFGGANASIIVERAQ
jgi:3-oxoacyl-[acyl-carrier-protein] synthase II